MNDNKTPDQKVDGMAIVAAILNRISRGHRERLVQSIQRREPDIAGELKARLIEFEHVAQLGEQGVQKLVKEIKQKDMAIAIKGASPSISHSLFKAMTARQRQELHDELLDLPEMSADEIEAAQQRVIIKLADLRSAGEIKEPPKRGVYV